jgi:hypothetical protein
MANAIVGEILAITTYFLSDVWVEICARADGLEPDVLVRTAMSTLLNRALLRSWSSYFESRGERGEKLLVQGTD